VGHYGSRAGCSNFRYNLAGMLSLIVSLLLKSELPLYHPTQAEVASAYKRADTLSRDARAKVSMLSLLPTWLDNGAAFWYRKETVDGKSEFIRVDCRTGAKTAPFDKTRLATALGKELNTTVDPDRLPFRSIRYVDGNLRFDTDDTGWELDGSTYTLKKVDREARTRPPTRPPWTQDLWPPSTETITSPNGNWVARIDANNIVIRPSNGTESPLTTDGTPENYYARLRWTADSKRLIAVKVKAGDRKKVYLIQTSPPTWGPAQLRTRVYDRPGDAVDTFEIVTYDPATGTAFTGAERVDYGGMPRLRPSKDGIHYTYEKMDRGYGRWRLLSLDPMTDKTTTLIDDDPPTFVDSTAQVTEYIDGTDELIYSSERDGWHHLYLADGKGGSTQITKGNWVVRSIARVDQAKRQIVFSASGMDPKEDPYNLHLYRIDFDGSHLVPLTPAKGNHSPQSSPDFQTIVDTYSSVDRPPVHELRNANTGALITQLEKADVSELTKTGWKPATPFVAKGRDGTTDIYGIYYKPSNFDPSKRYPVVEDIYAGPQDSFVRKAYSVADYDQTVAELGFIVVKIDGMGTRNRSKAFHDVCYQNLADAGFPDRILWMKALAKSVPSMDLDRVGIFGTSAGGQNAGGAVLFHPEFYKVAVASCGCHDNRLDKIWWNEQWMGVMGPHYAACSNIDNAFKLNGDLLLMVGELDTNVPPESTYRFAAALQAARKEYELVIIPNSDHTSGGPYGERKRRDFLVRHLLEVEPPNPNRE
jgi:dipeptidyl aminopeptidase/acylaminoacyl peptidase